MYPYVIIFGKEIGTYFICTLVGIIVCFFFAYFLAKKKGQLIEDLIITVVYILIGMFVGGHLVYGITNTSKIIFIFQHISEYNFLSFVVDFFGVCFGGMVFYGGLLGGIAAMWLVCRTGKYIPSNIMFDIWAICVPLFHTFGRIGCFMAGCCYGRETASFIGVTFPEGGLAPAGIKLIPTQLIEAVIDIFILIAVIIVLNKEKLRVYALPFYIITYSIMRFILEFFRGDPDRGFIGILSVSQCISILLIVISVVYIVKQKSLNKSST